MKKNRDLIRRDSVLWILRNALNDCTHFQTRDYYRIFSQVERLPSQQAFNGGEWCTDCKEYDHERHCCPRYNDVIRRTIAEIEDALQIIRCRECKHEIYCCNPCRKTDDGFCSNAKRKEDDQ